MQRRHDVGPVIARRRQTQNKCHGPMPQMHSGGALVLLITSSLFGFLCWLITPFAVKMPKRNLSFLSLKLKKKNRKISHTHRKMASTWHELYTNPANNGRVLRYCQWLPRDSVYSNRQISVGREGILGFVITWVESAPQAWSPEAEVTVDGGLGSDTSTRLGLQIPGSM